MLKRLIVVVVALVGLTLAACQPSASMPPAPPVPSPLPLGGAQTAATPQAPSAALPAPPSGPTTTPDPSFMQGSEQARGQVPVAPKSPNNPESEIKPTSQPPAVQPVGAAAVSKDRLVMVQGGKVWIVSADGKDRQALFGDNVPQLWSPPKDPGRAWLSPTGKYVMFLAGPQAAPWVSDIQGKNPRALLAQGVPVEGVASDKEIDKLSRKLLDQEVAWSPDESQVAFLAAPTGQPDLFVAKLPNGQAAPITNDLATHSELTWSPKGEMLAFKTRDENGGREQLYVLRGNQLIEVPTQTIAKLANEDDLGGVVNVTWLDDRRVAFTPVASTLASLGLWVFDTADNSVKQIYSDALTSPKYDPQTRRWLFLTGDGKGALRILDTGSYQVKTIVPEGVGGPIWTPDGKRIVYSKDNGTTYDIHIVNDDGSNDKTLAPDVMLIGENPPEPGPAGKRYFSPDGQRLIYTAVGSDYGSTGDNLENWWSVPLDGSQPATPITGMPRVFYLRQLGFSPDGQSIGFVGLRYSDRATHIWTISPNGANLNKLDAEVRWYRWLPRTAQP